MCLLARILPCLLISGVILFWSNIAHAQYKKDYGISIGGANYLGEIGGKDMPGRKWIRDLRLNQTRWAVGAFYRRRRNHTALKGSLTYARIQASDNQTQYTPRFSRNLSFRNDIFELALTGEYYFVTILDVGNRGTLTYNFDAYISLGGAVFYHNPMAEMNGKWHALQPLNTEGPGKSYQKIQPAIPLGIGFYYTYHRKTSRKRHRNSSRRVLSVHRFGAEFSLRYTFTDYLDDISTTYANPNDLESDLARALANRSSEVQGEPNFGSIHQYNEGSIRGNPKNKDYYLLFTLTYSHVPKMRTKFTKGGGIYSRQTRRWFFWKYAAPKRRTRF